MFIIYRNHPHDPADLEDKEANFSLGQFMTSWSQVESVLSLIFSELSGIPSSNAYIVIDQLSNKDRFDIIERLLSISDDEVKSALRPLISRADLLGRRRNRIVHAGWGKLGDEMARFWHGLTPADFTEISNGTDKGKSLRATSIFTGNELRMLASDAAKLQEELYRVYYEFRSKRVLAEVAEKNAQRKTHFDMLKSSFGHA